MPPENIQEKIQDLNHKMGEIESLLRHMTDTSSRSPSVEDKFKFKMQEMEQRLSEVMAKLEAPKASWQAAVKSQVERFESKIEQISHQRGEQIASVENDLKSRMDFFDARFSDLQALVDSHRHAISKETEMVLRMERLEAALKKMGRDRQGQEGEFERHIHAQIEMLRAHLDDLNKRQSEVPSDDLFLRSRLARLEESFQKMREKLPDTYSSDLEIKLRRLDERIQGVEALAHYRPKDTVDKESLKREISEIHRRLDQEAQQKDEKLRGLARELERSRSDIAAEYANLKEKWSAQDQHWGSRIGQVQHDTEALRNQFEKMTLAVQEELRKQGKTFDEQWPIVDEKIQSRGALIEDKMKQLEAVLEQLRIEGHQRWQEIERTIAEHQRRVEEQVSQAALQDQACKRLQEFGERQYEEISQKTLRYADEQYEHLGRQHFQQIKKKVFNASAKIFLVLILLLGGASYLLQMNMVSKIDVAVAGQFKNENLKMLLEQNALRTLPVLLQEVMAAFAADAHEKILTQENAFSRYLDEIKMRYDDTYQVVSREAELIRQRQQLSDWEEEILLQGSRAAWEKMKAAANQKHESALIAGAILKRTARLYLSMDRTQSTVLSFQDPSGRILKNEEIPSKVLRVILKTHSRWEYRAKAAWLLKDAKEESGVAVDLIAAARVDTHLEVVKNALLSFEAITGFKSPDPLDPFLAETHFQRFNAEAAIKK